MDPKTHQIVFDGDPNENMKDFRDAQRLFPEATVQEISAPPAPPPPKVEAVYIAAALWILIGVLVLAGTLGLGVRLFMWAAGL